MAFEIERGQEQQQTAAQYPHRYMQKQYSFPMARLCEDCFAETKAHKRKSYTYHITISDSLLM